MHSALLDEIDPYDTLGSEAVAKERSLEPSILARSRDDGGCSVSPPRRFIAARLARLYPLYILALALDAPFVVAHLAKLHSGSGELFVAVLGVIFAALLVQSWWLGTAMGWNSPGWSLSCEAFFYVLWPAAAPRLRVSARASWWIAGLVWCVALAAPLMLLTLRAKQLVPARCLRCSGR